jgi:CSLREA domain-containing protein
MTTMGTVIALFAFFNAVRVIAYLPQIVTLWRVNDGAPAVSCTTWVLFAASHLSTVCYALLALADWRMALIFGVNAVCCLAIVGLVIIKRIQHARSTRGIDGVAERRLGASAVLAAPLGLALAASHSIDGQAANAATCTAPIVVTTHADEADPDGCAGKACSLREALALAETCARTEPVIVRLATGRYGLGHIGFAHPLAPTPIIRARGNSAFVVTGSLRIEGEGALIEREPDVAAFRLFDVAPDAELALVGVSLRGGMDGAHEGGAIHVRQDGRLMLDRSKISGSVARLGGAIYAAGLVHLTNSRIAGNQADRGGGLFVAPTGVVRARGGQFRDNVAVGSAGIGGAIESLGELDLRGTEIVDNGARHGGAISAGRPGRLTMQGGRVANNTAAQRSAALELLSDAEIADVVYERNTPADCAWRFASPTFRQGCAGTVLPKRWRGGAWSAGLPDAQSRSVMAQRSAVTPGRGDRLENTGAPGRASP